MTDRWLLLETSGRVGEVGLALGDTHLASVPLDSGRQHARDLAPTIASLLKAHDWRAADLTAVAVSLGPGSYTGLRIGVATAQALGYALGCRIVGVPTFHRIARQTDTDSLRLDVAADALKGKVYVQSFARPTADDDWTAATELRIEAADPWRTTLTDATAVSGPAESNQRTRPSTQVLLELAATGRYDVADLFRVEPLYLRPSSAEEQWDRRP